MSWFKPTNTNGANIVWATQTPVFLPYVLLTRGTHKMLINKKQSTNNFILDYIIKKNVYK